MPRAPRRLLALHIPMPGEGGTSNLASRSRLLRSSSCGERCVVAHASLIRRLAVDTCTYTHDARFLHQTARVRGDAASHAKTHSATMPSSSPARISHAAYRHAHPRFLIDTEIPHRSHQITPFGSIAGDKATSHIILAQRHSRQCNTGGRLLFFSSSSK